MKIDIQRAIEVLAATGYECDEIQTLKEQLEAANTLIRTYRAEPTYVSAGELIGRELTPAECRELGFFLGEMAAKNPAKQDLATLYPFPKNLESPEFRLLFEIGEMMRKLGNLTHAERLHALALRLQAEWLKAVKA